MVQDDGPPPSGLRRSPLSLAIMTLAVICVGWTSLELLGGLSLYQAKPQISDVQVLEIERPALVDESRISLSHLHGKLFSLTKDDELIPYYMTGSKTVEAEDITVTGMITADKLDVLLNVVEQYNGPISITLHLDPTQDELNKKTLQDIKRASTTSQVFHNWVDIHILYSRQKILMNLWRNIASYYSRTDWIMMLDIDLFPCTDFRNHILGNETMVGMLREGYSAFIVPAFQYVDDEQGLDVSTFPRDKQALLSLVQDETIKQFYFKWPPSHRQTDYPKWFAPETTSIYQVAYGTERYEPYVIYNRNIAPWCQERFTGYGSDKIACVWEMYMNGIDFYVLPEDFIIHRSHEKPVGERFFQIDYNKWVYKHYVEEACVLALRRAMADGTFGSPRSDHMKEVCGEFEQFKLFEEHYELDAAMSHLEKEKEKEEKPVIVDAVTI